MPGRNRRLRLLAFGALVFFSLLVYTRNLSRSRRAERYQDYFGDKLLTAGIGGGSVLRPSLGEIPLKQERYPVPKEPEKEDYITVWVDAPEDDAQPQEQPGEEHSEEGGEHEREADHEESEAPTSEDFWADVDGRDHGPQSGEQVRLDDRPADQQVQGGSDNLANEPDDSPASIAKAEVEQAAKANDAYADNTVDEDDGLDKYVEPTEMAAPPVEHWKRQKEHYPVKTVIELPSGSSKPFPRIQRAEKKLAQNGADKDRLAMVKSAAQHSWDGYRKVAFGADEVKPNSGRENNPFNGWGATLVDSLDTLWIMGMKEEFAEAVEKVGDIDFTTSTRPDIPVFETTIRYLGGLLGGYDVSGRDPKFRKLLDKATELAEVLYGAFDTPNRMPQTYYRWAPASTSQRHRAGSRAVMSELGSLSVEFTRLAQITGDAKYYDAIARITDAFEEAQNSTRLPGMWPTQLDASGCGLYDERTPNPHFKSEPVDHPDGSGLQMVSGDAVNGNGQTSPAHGVAPPRGPSRQQRIDEVMDRGEPGLTKLNGAGDFLDHATKNAITGQDASINNLGAAKMRRDTSSIYEVDESCAPQGLVSSSRMGTETFTLSGMSDSTYEYLPKQYLLLGGLVEQYKSMYLYSADAVIQNLLYKPMTIDQRDILMSGELKLRPNSSAADDDTKYRWVRTYNPEVAHLACFAGGMFAMGGIIFDKPEHVDIGSKLTEGCVWAYNSTASGIMPEGGSLMACPDTWGECPWNQTAYWNELDPMASTRRPSSKEQSQAFADAAVQVLEKLANPDVSKSDTTTPRAASPKSDEDESKGDGYRQLRKRDSEGTQTRDASNDGAVESLHKRAPPPPVYYDEEESQATYIARKVKSERLPPGFVRISGKRYILRPEAIESVFYMYRITGDTHWREVGWNMFTAVERHTRADFGASAIDDITSENPVQLDSEESFWMAETLKYFYLLYDDPARWSLDDWVLNTEAHFLKRPQFKFST